jgi:Flp pilus assembly protein TadB
LSRKGREGEIIIISKKRYRNMTRQIPARAGGGGSLLKNIVILVVALMVAVILLHIIGFLAGILIFALVVYIVYLVLRHYF